MNNEEFEELKLSRLHALSELSRLKAIVSNQKANWVCRQIPTSLLDRVEAEDAVFQAQQRIDEINYDLQLMRENISKEKQKSQLQILTDILVERGLGDILHEAQERVAALGYPKSREISIKY